MTVADLSAFSPSRRKSIVRPSSKRDILRSVRQFSSTFVKENFRVLTSPSGPTLSNLADDDPKPDASATVTFIASFAQLQHPVAQFVAHYPTCWGRSCRDRSRSCGYKLANDGQDTRAIQHYLGHRSIVSTVRYTALAPDRFKRFWKD
jgi:integrase-like protein